MSQQPNSQTCFETPPILLAILLAAHRAGDRSLERTAKNELAERHGIEVKIRRQAKREEVCRAG